MRAFFISLSMLFVAGCTQAFFQPHRYIVATPGQYGVEYQPVEFKAADGTALFAWFLPARGAPRATVLYLHGNAENISTHFANVAWMPAAGFNVLALDYRGYGGSQGSPTLEGVQLDIDAAMRTLLARPDVDPARIIIFGQSLGGSLAIHYGARSAYRGNVRAIVVDSAFSDYRRIVREKLASFFLTWPFQWLLPQTVDNDFSPSASVRAVSPIPLLFIHGERDTVVSVEHSQRLFERAASPKELWILPEAGHIQAVRDKAVRARLAEFLTRRAAAPSSLAFR
ncbi:MAG: hypothetical protein A3G28_01680 [Betaproteobacteria bacterium RIFCSPLOWO2_12_FULL_68_19]|nr:MAG: hypothetical protein A3G28_01680 [Betaproteobacteria bacterium RIFCSPLOWO2_12_FULL_68_19]